MKHLFLSLLSFLLLLSCSKSDDNGNTPITPNTTSLPVKITTTNSNGIINKVVTLNYDSQKRISKITIIAENVIQNETQTISYENGKVTINKKFPNDLTRGELKQIYVYDSNGIKREELYHNNILSHTLEWYYRPDGGKERRIKKSDGSLFATLYYRFTSAGNIERMVYDSALGEDFEYTYSNYDNKPRMNAYARAEILKSDWILLDQDTFKFTIPNNPQAYTVKNTTTGSTVLFTIEYSYNNKNQVTVAKRKNNGSTTDTTTIEYQEF